METPDTILNTLMEGNKRFSSNLRINRDLLGQVESTKGGQSPKAAILSCMDSRAPAEVIFDQGIGDIFSMRVAGNVVSKDMLGSLEFAVCAMGVKLVMVLGHTGCGAIKGACDGVELGHLTSLLEKIKPAVDSETTVTAARNGSNREFVDKVSWLNVHLSIREILERSSLLAEASQRGEIRIVPAMYNISDGIVTLH